MPAATYTDAGCRAAGAGVRVPKRSQRLQKHETHKGNKQKAHGLSPTFSRRNLTFVTFLGEFTFLGPRPEPDPLPRSSVSERLESATPFVYAVSDALGQPRDLMCMYSRKRALGKKYNPPLQSQYHH